MLEQGHTEAVKSHWTISHICKQLRVLKVDLEPVERFRWTKIGLVELIKLRDFLLVTAIRKLFTPNDKCRDQTRNDMQHGDCIINLGISACDEALVVTNKVE